MATVLTTERTFMCVLLKKKEEGKEKKAEGIVAAESCLPHGALWTQDPCWARSAKMKACNIKLEKNKCTTKVIMSY